MIIWFTVLVCILIIPKLFHTPDHAESEPLPKAKSQESQEQSQVIATIREYGEEDGPLVGKSTGTREKLQDVVNSFLSFINEGKLDEAGTMIDANYLFDLMARDRPTNQGVYIQEYVHLFEVGELKKAKIIPPNEISRNMSCKVEIELRDGRILNLIIGLSEMTTAHDQDKQWYFKEITRL
ncbi:hypothetical protein [Paenibacillus periandrae]|uniref:hypothetical protein n=1 Tax=Paenibacillus periandrae TaxID=1761741 RepID=UPI001F0893C9|nr:hypothetical protein [Paenibacillus periandrae]